MDERTIIYTINEGSDATTLGDNFLYWTIPKGITIVHVSAAPSADDAACTIDINDDGADAITAISCAVKITPGTWATPGYGGTNDAVTIAAGSKISLDANSIDAARRVTVVITALINAV